jgi:hypothetical protein
MKDRHKKERKKAGEIAIEILVLFGDERQLVCDLALIEAFTYQWEFYEDGTKKDAMAHCDKFCDFLKKHLSAVMDGKEKTQPPAPSP